MDGKSHISGWQMVTVMVILLGMSCAKISSPGGGPRDTDPPVILKSEPVNGTTMFGEKSFSVSFDEYVVLDKINDKFMVSPPLTTKPGVKIKGKEIVVSWDEKLADSTTYTFYFQDAIRDNNENNPIPNFQYVFSTGPVLDSLSVSGNVFNAFDLEVVSDMTVMMYSNLSDTAPRRIIPAYISRPDPSGGFVISNVRPGNYRLYAVKDLNGNKIYDLDDETFAFCDSILVITPAENSKTDLDTISFKPAAAPETTKPYIYTFGRHRIYAFTAEPRKQYLKFAERRSAGLLTFGLALPHDTTGLSVILTDVPPEAWFMEQNSRRDSFRLWITDAGVYDRDLIEACLTYPFTDSTGSDVIRKDTTTLRYTKPPAGRGSLRKPTRSFTTNLGSRIRPGTVAWFSGSAPMNQPDTSRMSFSQLIDTIAKKLPVIFTRDTTDSRRYIMTAAFIPGATYSLRCLDGAFSDIYGITSDSTVYKFTVSTSEDYGSVSATLSGYAGAVIVQLLGDREKVVREIFVTSPGKIKFGLLDKGRYRMKVIYDLDGNREWTTGDFRKRRDPEPVSYYAGELDVKINWELEQDWDISLMNRKDVSLRSKPETKR